MSISVKPVFIFNCSV